MAEDAITNAVLLQHMQSMKSDLQTQISGLDKKLTGATEDLRLLKIEVRQGFEDVRQRQDSMQEDLEASIQMLGRHQRKLARMS